MAHEYRALLDSRSYDNLRSHTAARQLEEDREAEWQAGNITRRMTLDTIRSAVSRRSPPSPPPLPLQPQATTTTRQLTTPVVLPDADPEGRSPVSDGTLVDFEEDAIYFKPAFSPEALSPIPEDDDGAAAGGRVSPPLLNNPAAPPQPEALSLQVTMELLTRELAGTLRRSQTRGPAAEVPSLQTWLMIEAYEKLQARVLDMCLPVGEAAALRDVFEVWLGALHRVHEGLAEEGGGGAKRRVERDSLRTVHLN